MMTVKEVSKLTGVTIRTLQYYDTIGLLPATEHTESGYRLYDDTAMERLQQIKLLTMKKEHLEKLINFACKIRTSEENEMNVSVFDTNKMDEYARQVKKQWGQTVEYKEYEEKTNNQSLDTRKRE